MAPSRQAISPLGLALKPVEPHFGRTGTRTLRKSRQSGPTYQGHSKHMRRRGSTNQHSLPLAMWFAPLRWGSFRKPNSRIGRTFHHETAWGCSSRCALVVSSIPRCFQFSRRRNNLWVWRCLCTAPKRRHPKGPCSPCSFGEIANQNSISYRRLRHCLRQRCTWLHRH